MRTLLTTSFAALLVALLAGCATTAPHPGSSDDPFPLVEGARWTYEGQHRGRTDRYTLELHGVSRDGVRLFVFEAPDADPKTRILVGNMFADELFHRVDERVLVADESRPDDDHLLLRLPLRVDDESSYRVGERTTLVRVVTFETVTVPMGSFQAWRLEVVERPASGRVAKHSVWLAPGVGLVRWERSTGRVDELLHFSPR